MSQTMGFMCRILVYAYSKNVVQQGYVYIIRQYLRNFKQNSLSQCHSVLRNPISEAHIMTSGTETKRLRIRFGL